MYSGICKLSNFREQEHKELSGLGLHTPSKRCAFLMLVSVDPWGAALLLNRKCLPE
jgi:hypothetical protein